MNSSTREFPLYSVGLVMLIACGVFGGSALSQSAPPQATVQPTGCTPEQRREALRALQTKVLQVAPQQLDSLVSSSRGAGTPGSIYTFAKSRGPTEHAGALPPGPEDLSYWASQDQLWTLAEHPGNRSVLAVNASAF